MPKSKGYKSLTKNQLVAVARIMRQEIDDTIYKLQCMTGDRTAGRSGIASQLLLVDDMLNGRRGEIVDGKILNCGDIWDGEDATK